MPDIRSALKSGYPAPGHYGREDSFGVTLREVLSRDLAQVAAWRDSHEAVADRLAKLLDCPVPNGGRRAVSGRQVTIFQVAPGRYWIAAPRGEGIFGRLADAIPIELGAVTELGHSRCAIRISGPASRAVLARGFALDLEPEAFPAGSFAQTQVHHIPALIHRPGDDPDLFEVLVMRTYGLSFWEWLFETAQSFGCTLEAPQV